MTEKGYKYPDLAYELVFYLCGKKIINIQLPLDPRGGLELVFLNSTFKRSTSFY